MIPADEHSSLSKLLTIETWPREQSWDLQELQNGLELRMQGIVPGDLFHLSGHFPENPLVPGFVLVSWALGSVERALRREVKLIGLRQVKFRQPLRPGCVFMLHITLVDSAATPRKATFSFTTRAAPKGSTDGTSTEASEGDLCSGVIDYE